jgi:isoamylase
MWYHTAEGDHRGPTLCFRGVDNSSYCILENNRSLYANFSGTGNTLNVNHPVVRRMIVESLRYWWRKCTSMVFGSTLPPS